MIDLRRMADVAWAWGLRCFGRDHMHNLPLRALRLVEEAVELAQNQGVPREKMLTLVNMVYKRPPGTPRQELGGVFLTSLVFALTAGYDPESVIQEEIARCLALPEDHFRRRNQEKVDMGMTA